MVAFPWLVLHDDPFRAVHGRCPRAVHAPLRPVRGGRGRGARSPRQAGVMVAADIVRGGLVLAVPFVAHTRRAACSRWRSLRACATVFFDPGLMALLPDIVPGRRPVACQLASSPRARTSRRSSATRPPGSSSSTSSTRTVFTVDAATFGVSAVTLLAMTLGGAAAESRRDDRRRRAPPQPGFWAGDPRGVLLPAPPRRAARQHHARRRGGGRRGRLLPAHVPARGRAVPRPAHLRLHGGRHRRRLPRRIRSSWAPSASACARAWP